MKTLKNLKFGILAVLLGFGLVVTQSAFTRSSVQYHYKLNGSSIDQAASWEPVIGAPAFSCEETEELPCVISVEGDLQTFLNGKDVDDIMNSGVVDNTKSY